MEFGIFEDNIKKLIESVTKGITDEVLFFINNRILEYEAEEYNRNYYAKTILHRANPKPLLDFYVPLFIRKQENRRQNDKISTQNINELFKKSKYLTLIGGAGSGKSTIVKYLFINCIQSKYKIPIKIELRYLNDYNEGLIDYIKNEIFKLNKLSTNDNIIDRLLSSGKFTIFLDGYDELSSAIKEKTTKEIDDLVKIYNKNDYLLTSRPYTNIELLPLFHNYYVCDLEEAEIDLFVKKQIPENEIELANKIIETIHKEENMAFQSFLRNPLLLSMFILTFQSYANVPQKRNLFYRQVFDALFTLHDSMSKLAFVREKQSGLSKEQFEEILRLFSFLSFFEQKFVFTESYLNEKLSTIKEIKKLSFDNEKLIEDLQIAIGILNKDGIEYTFPHRSLQEFFAAEYITNLNEKNKELIYGRLFNSIKERPIILIDTDNFYSLLMEIDISDFTKWITIPMLSNIEELLKCSQELSEFQSYVAYGNIILVLQFILRDKDLLSKYSSDETKIRYVFLGAVFGHPRHFDRQIKNGKEQLDAETEFKKFVSRKERDIVLDFKAMTEKCYEFKLNTQQIIQELWNKIKDEERSDEDIINLISKIV